MLRFFHPDAIVIEPELLWGGGDGVLAVMTGVPELCDTPVLVLTTDRNRAAIYSISQFAISDYWVHPVPGSILTARLSRLTRYGRCDDASFDTDISDSLRRADSSKHAGQYAANIY